MVVDRHWNDRNWSCGVLLLLGDDGDARRGRVVHDGYAGVYKHGLASRPDISTDMLRMIAVYGHYVQFLF